MTRLLRALRFPFQLPRILRRSRARAGSRWAWASRLQQREERPEASAVEGRILLSTLQAQWRGQDGHDFVGRSSALGASGVQDARIDITGLAANRGIATLMVEGYGGGLWRHGGPPGSWLAYVDRAADGESASVFFEPYEFSPPREYHLTFRYDDGATEEVYLQGGAVDPALRSESAKLQLGWGGQASLDLTSASSAVGSDGYLDARIELSGLAAQHGIAAVRVSGPSGRAWSYGLNHEGALNAEFLRNAFDATRGSLLLQPLERMEGQGLRVQVVYSDGSMDSAAIIAGAADPRSAAPRSGTAIEPRWDRIVASWKGQIVDAGSPWLGEAEATIAGLPADRTIVSAALSDGRSGLWAYRTDGLPASADDPEARPLALVRDADRSRAELRFATLRDLAGERMLLRLTMDDGSIFAAEFAGRTVDPGLRLPEPAPSAIRARPGDDLQALADRYGTVTLAPGVYPLAQPLVLSRPVRLIGEAGAVLQFQQPAGESWTSAIKIHASRTTLDGFAVRFSGPVRWSAGLATEPAVISVTDHLDAFTPDPKFDLHALHLDLEGPPVQNGEQAPLLIRFVGASGGEIRGNRLRGGGVYFSGGPWTIADNVHLGVQPGAWAWDAFSGRDAFDTVIRGNRIEPAPGSGQLYRFLVLTQSGREITVENNHVRGIGQLLNDPANANEIFLTESYRLRFEGTPESVSSDGRTLRIPAPQGGPARTGDVVAILSGPHAGEWRRIAQRIDGRTYLLDSPLPTPSNGEAFAISIADGGFVGQVYRNNRIEAPANSVASLMKLVGNHFGTQVLNNQLIGGAESLRVSAYPTESPNLWGWSRAPFLGGRIADNLLQDSLAGAIVEVHHSPYTKSTAERTYLTADLDNNLTVWSPAFADAIADAITAANAPPILTIGAEGSLDPREALVNLGRHWFDGPPSLGTIRVIRGMVNGAAQTDQRVAASLVEPPLPAVSARLALDSGRDSADRITNDGRVTFSMFARAVGYEYRVGDGPYQAIPPQTRALGWGEFLPSGLTQGENRVRIRAIDALGRPGAESETRFVYDTVASIAAAPIYVSGLMFQVQAEPEELARLLEEGQEVGQRVGPGVIALSANSNRNIADAVAGRTRSYALSLTDLAGNQAASPAIQVQLPASPPTPTPTPKPTPVPVVIARPRAQWLRKTSGDSVGVRAAGRDGKLDARIRIFNLSEAQASAIVVAEIRGSRSTSLWRLPGNAKAPRITILTQEAGDGSFLADLTFQPAKPLKADRYQVELGFSDGQTLLFEVRGAAFDPELRVTPIRRGPK